MKQINLILCLLVVSGTVAHVALAEESKKQLSKELEPLRWLIGEFEDSGGEKEWRVYNFEAKPNESGSAILVSYKLSFRRDVQASMSVRETIDWDTQNKSLRSRYEIYDTVLGWGDAIDVDGNGEYQLAFSPNGSNELSATGKFRSKTGNERDLRFKITRMETGGFRFKSDMRFKGIYTLVPKNTAGESRSTNARNIRTKPGT